MKKIPYLICLLILLVVAEEGVARTLLEESGANDVAAEIALPSMIPKEHLENEEDAYLEGYIQSLVNANYYEFDVLVYVENGDVYLYNLPKNTLLKKSILHFVEDLPSVKTVTAVDKLPEKELKKLEKREVKPQVRGVWFPQATVLYPPMIANPRATIYSAAYRMGDQVMGTSAIGVSYGDNFPIFRWRHVWGTGDLQIGIQAGVWSVFNMNVDRDHEMSELVNTDYLLAIPLSYAFDKWSFRLRVYHVSGHLGDEFLVNHPTVVRLNPSMEALDFFVSYQISSAVRSYIGLGWVFHSDRTFPITPPLYVEYGGEWRFLGHRSIYHRLYGTLFLAVYIRHWQVNHWRIDGTYMFGYELSKLQGVGRKMRLFVNYHHGYSEGQFFKETTSYASFGLSWGF